MKYFTPELYQRLQDFHDEAAMDDADEAWERASARYRRFYRRIRKTLPLGLQKLLGDYVLHDADVLGMGGRGKEFVMVLRLAPPPRQLLILHYRLVRPALVKKDAFLVKGRGSAQWLYDEVDVEQDAVVHSVLLSNGWEVQLPLGDVKVTQSEALYPHPDTKSPVNGARVSRSA